MKTLYLLFLFFLLSFSSFGARYWVATGPGNWSNPINWSTSNGGPGGATVPTILDITYFNGNGLGDCTIDIPAAAFGLRVEVGYTSTITHASSSLTLGAQHFYVRDGVMDCGSAVVTVAGNLYQYGGTLTASSNSISLAGNLQFLGGVFNHNNGKVEMINVANKIFNVTTTTPLFYDFEMNGGHNIQLTLGAADTLKVLNNFIGTDGIVRGSPVLVYKNAQLNLNFDGGTSSLNFVGSQNGICNFNSGNWVDNHWFIDKDATATTVTFVDEDGDNLLTAGSTLKTITIERGTLAFEDNVVCDLNFSNLDLETNGILKGASEEILFSGSYTNSGGFLNANFGQFTFDGANSTFISCPNTVNNLFHTVKVNKDHAVTFNIQPGDTLKSSNKTILSNGFVNTGRIAIVDTCLVESTFDYGSSALSFVEAGNSWFLFDGGTWPTTNVRIEKANTTDIVLFEDVDGDNLITAGQSLSNLNIQTGCIAFETGIVADLDFGSLNLLPAGILQGSDNEVRFSGSYSNTGGQFVHNAGLFKFDGITSRNITSSVTDIFYDLTIEQGNAVVLFIDPATNIRITNELLLADGLCNQGTLYAEGNVTISPTFDRGSSPLVFAGSQAQTFDLTGAISNFDGNISFAKSSANTITLLSPFLFTGASHSLTFTKGYLVTSLTNVFTIDDNVSYTGGSDSSFVHGPMVKVGNDAFVFPVGKDSVYARIGISAPSLVTDVFRAEYFAETPNTLFNILLKDLSIHHVSTCEYWTLDRVSGSSVVVVDLSWNTPRSCGVTDLSELIVTRWNGFQWVNHGNGGTTGNTTAGTISSNTGITSFSPFTLGSTTINNPLPIELIDFNAELAGREVELRWQTANEVNNASFTVEKSLTGKDWTEVSSLLGAGNSTHVLDYVSYDKTPSNGINYYRLKQIDFDGNFTYSSIRSVNVNGVESDRFLLYPNPATDYVYLHTTSNVSETVLLTDAKGKMIVKQRVDSDLTKIDLRHLPKGIYFVQIGTQVQKVTLF